MYVFFSISFPHYITGLKDLADYLPASLATIVSYLSAEVTRGVWKPVFMNGTDWPSPAANLLYVEEHIKKILAATGVDIPSLAAGLSALPKLKVLIVPLATCSISVLCIHISLFTAPNIFCLSF